MKNKEELCLQLRNRTTRDQETYCKHYTKKFSGYIRHLLVNFQTIGLVIAMIFAGLFVGLTRAWEDEDKMGFYIGAAFFVIAFLFLMGKIIIGLWFWKYDKHVVVTNEGIWIMWYSTFWWSKDFTGKKRLLSPCWSFYSWSEIKITDDPKARPRSPVKTANFFDDVDHAVKRSSQLTTLYMARWDGMKQIDFLDDVDAQEILSYAKEQQKRKKRKKKDMEIIEEEYDKAPDDEYVADDENNNSL